MATFACLGRNAKAQLSDQVLTITGNYNFNELTLRDVVLLPHPFLSVSLLRSLFNFVNHI
jgi:hypothetical protein